MSNGTRLLLLLSQVVFHITLLAVQQLAGLGRRSVNLELFSSPTRRRAPYTPERHTPQICNPKHPIALHKHAHAAHHAQRVGAQHSAHAARRTAEHALHALHSARSAAHRALAHTQAHTPHGAPQHAHSAWCARVQHAQHGS